MAFFRSVVYGLILVAVVAANIGGVVGGDTYPEYIKQDGIDRALTYVYRAVGVPKPSNPVYRRGAGDIVEKEYVFGYQARVIFFLAVTIMGLILVICCFVCCYAEVSLIAARSRPVKIYRLPTTNGGRVPIPVNKV